MNWLERMWHRWCATYCDLACAHIRNTGRGHTAAFSEAFQAGQHHRNKLDAEEAYMKRY